MSRADKYERYMLDLINVERAKVGAPPLQLEQNLNEAADAHSDWMLRVDIFDHTGVGGSTPTERMRAADFDFSGSWRSAENIAVQSERGPDGIMDDVANLHTSLMNSPGHRANILNPDLEYVGIGIALGDFDFSSGTYESVIVTQNFAKTGGSVDLDPAIVAPTALVVADTSEPAVLVVAPSPAPAPDPVPDAPATPTPAATDDTFPADGIANALYALLAGGTGTDTPDIDLTVFNKDVSQKEIADTVITFAQDHAVLMRDLLSQDDGLLLQFDDLAF